MQGCRQTRWEQDARAGFFGLWLIIGLAQGATAWEAGWGTAPQPEVLPKALPRAAVPVSSILTDPSGDHVTSSGNPIVDIVGVEAGTDGTAVTLKITFSAKTVMSKVGGFIGLDTDQNATTGVSFTDLDAMQDIGADFVLNLFGLPSGGQVIIYTTAAPSGYRVGKVPAVIKGQSLKITVPLSMLGGDDGNMDVAMVLGNDLEATDAAPDAGHGTVASVGGVVNGVSPRQIICTNTTTGKTVRIEEPAGSWDCEAAGLVVNPGDTIRQTVTGKATKAPSP
jgi:hypothetical protein